MTRDKQAVEAAVLARAVAEVQPENADLRGLADDALGAERARCLAEARRLTRRANDAWVLLRARGIE
jgi:hypothetical protein